MAIVPVAAAFGSLVELEDIGSSVESLARLVESQKELFHSQIDQLQKIVVTQCKLTGANPLAQEMAAGALSIKIGKRPRDLLNPKAVKYMQSLFSIKDTIGKKETREISAFCGITVTQVRDYFSSQRTKVRKLVRMSHEKATKCDESKTAADECSISPLQSVPPGEDIPVCTSDFSTVGDFTQISRNSGNITSPCTQSPPTPENAISVCTQLHGNPRNGTLVCPQVPGSFGNVTSVCTQIPVYPGNFTTVCAQVPGHIGNFSAVSAPVPANSGNITNVFTPILGYSEIVTAVGTLVPGSFLNVTPVQDGQLAPTKTNVKAVEEGPSKSLLEETTPGVDSDDKKFLENIFNLMRKEQTFSGQEKLLEWVLQIHNSAVLSWFLTKGGITILAGWLSEAALEEQTTMLLIIFKVLCHLPLNKAQPVQMSDILKTVNKLRFYRSSGNLEEKKKKKRNQLLSPSLPTFISLSLPSPRVTAGNPDPGSQPPEPGGQRPEPGQQANEPEQLSRPAPRAEHRPTRRPRPSPALQAEHARTRRPRPRPAASRAPPPASVAVAFRCPAIVPPVFRSRAIVWRCWVSRHSSFWFVMSSPLM